MLAELVDVVIGVDTHKNTHTAAVVVSGLRAWSIEGAGGYGAGLAREHLAQPRSEGERAALALLLTVRRSAVDAARVAQQQLQAFVVTAPEVIRARFRGKTGHRRGDPVVAT